MPWPIWRSDCLAIHWRQSLAAAALSAWLGPTATDLVQAAPAEDDRLVAVEGREQESPEARNCAATGTKPSSATNRPRPRRAEPEEPARNVMNPEALRLERRELETQVQRLRRQLESLRPDQDSESRQLDSALRQLRAQLQELRRVDEPGRIQTSPAMSCKGC